MDGNLRTAQVTVKVTAQLMTTEAEKKDAHIDWMYAL